MQDSDNSIININLLIRIWICSVSALSAFVNMSGFLAYAYSLSHYSGNYISVIDDFYHHAFQNATLLLVFCMAFVAGGAIASFINVNKDFHLESKYGEIQFAIGIIILFFYLVYFDKDLFILFLSCALGIQNGLIRSYRGMGFKTTHVSGTFTDLGTYIGYFMRGLPDMAWRIRFELSLLFAFGTGTISGLLLFREIHDHVFIVAGLGYVFSGLFYFLLRYLNRRNRQDSK